MTYEAGYNLPEIDVHFQRSLESIKLIYEKNKTCETYNVCGDESITINNLIKLLKDELDVVHHKVINTSDSLFPNQSFEFSNDKIKSNYSISFTKLKDGIKQYIKEYNEF